MARFKKIAILAGVVAAALLGGFFLYRAQNLTVERNLSQKDRETYEGRLREALSIIEDLSKREQDSKTKQDLFDAYMGAGAQQYGLGLLADAQESYEKATKTLPQSPAGWLSLAGILQERGKYSQAKTAYEQALMQAPKVPGVWTDYLNFMREYGDVEPADMEREYLRALQATGSHADILSLYAKYQESLGKKEAARDLWYEAVKQKPGMPQYQAEYERLLQETAKN